MTGVFREISLEWNGEAYPFTPSNKLLRRIEREVSFVDLINRSNDGRFPIFDIAYVMTEFLKSAGVRGVTEDEDYGVLARDMQDNNSEGIAVILGCVVEAISPPGEDPKKAAAAQSKPPPQKQKRHKSTGA